MANYSVERPKRRWNIVHPLMLATCAVFVPVGERGGLAEDLPLRLTIKAGAARHVLLAFSPDSKTLAFTDDKLGVIFWDLMENKKRGTLKKRQEGYSILEDGQGGYLPTLPPNTLLGKLGKQFPNIERPWDKRDGMEPHWHLWFMAFSPDGGTLALGENDGILLWDVAAGKERDQIARDMPFMYAVAFAPDGKILAIAGEGKDAGPQKVVQKVVLWDLVRREERAKISGNLGTRRVVFAPDLKTLAFSSLREDILTSVVDLEQPLGDKRCAMLPSAKFLIDDEIICFDPDGKILACQGRGDRINLWDVKTKKWIAVIENDLDGGVVIEKVVFSPDSRMLVVMDNDGRIHLWEIASQKERSVFYGAKSVTPWDVPFAFSPDGQMFAVRCRDGTIKVWDLARVNRKPPDAAETARLWALLADEDAAAAYRAIRTLTAFPSHLLPLLRKQLYPLPNSEDQSRKIDRLLADLNSDDFGVRQKSSKELEHFDWRAEEALQRTLEGHPSLEVRRRVSALLENIEHRGAVESIQQLRALEVLEHIGTAEARGLLKDIAKGVPEARLRQEAKASLARLAKRPTPKP